MNSVNAAKGAGFSPYIDFDQRPRALASEGKGNRAAAHRLPAIMIVVLVSTLSGSGQRLTLTAPSGKPRLAEVIEIPLTEARQHIKDIEHKVAQDALTHKPLSTQIDADQLLIAVEIPATGKLTIDFVPGDINAQPPQVFGREATERKDDYAWENKYVAYRVYGPALEATGEITSGIDVWSKRVPNFVIDSFYKHDAIGQRTHNPALSYHKDDGVGLDSYEVGKTRGCGGTGVISGGKLWVSNNYTHLKQLSTGPVRFQFELTYAPWKTSDGKAGEIEVTETKRITLDAGTHLNRIDSTFTFSGAAVIDAVAGLAVHKGADFTQLDKGEILSVWDTPQDPTADRIATGMIEGPNQTATATQLNNQAFLVFPVHSAQTFTYYAGSGWSKADMPTPQAWNTYLQQTLDQLKHPAHHRWEGKGKQRLR